MDVGGDGAGVGHARAALFGAGDRWPPFWFWQVDRVRSSAIVVARVGLAVGGPDLGTQPSSRRHIEPGAAGPGAYLRRGRCDTGAPAYRLILRCNFVPLYR